MATAKTGSFRLTETVTIPNATASGARVTGTIDLGAYINVASGQAIAIEEVDFIVQIGADFSGPISQVAAADCALNGQLVDLNPSTAFVRADDQSLIASHHLDVDQGNNVGTATQDFYPDNMGPTNLSESYLVVNDTLYFTVGIDGAAAADVIYLTAIVKSRVVKLSKMDWMAIAIQSTADSN